MYSTLVIGHRKRDCVGLPEYFYLESKEKWTVSEKKDFAKLQKIDILGLSIV